MKLDPPRIGRTWRGTPTEWAARQEAMRIGALCSQCWEPCCEADRVLMAWSDEDQPQVWWHRTCAEELGAMTMADTHAGMQ